MMNKDRLIGAIGSSLIGVGVTGILYAISLGKKVNEEAETDIQDGIGVEDEEMKAVAELLDEETETAE